MWRTIETRRLLVLAGALVGIIVIGCLGFMLVEGENFLQALYMTVITLSTVGYGEVRAPSPAGRVFTIFLIMGGVSLVAYAFGTMIEFVVGGQLTGLYRRRAVRKRIEALSGHYIVCGFGRVGEAVTSEFKRRSAPFVVIDNRPEPLQRLAAADILTVEGDASEDEVLTAAGVERARGLVAAVDSDAENTFVVLSARQLNRDLFIVARANSEESVSKLRRAGADEVISPYTISGTKIATLLLQPVVSDYLDVVTGGGELEFRLEEFVLNETCAVVGKSINELDIRRRTGASILAVRHGAKGAFDTNPSPDTILDQNDLLVAIGTPEEMARLEELFACRIPPQTGRG